MQKIPASSIHRRTGLLLGQSQLLFRPKAMPGTQEVLVSHGSLQGGPVSGIWRSAREGIYAQVLRGTPILT